MPKLTRWHVFQVVLPIGGPILLSLIFVGFERAGRPEFEPSLAVIVDLTPRALTFYTLALICVTLSDFWPHISRHKVVGASTVFIGALVSALYAKIVVWRHDAAYEPSGGAFVVASILTLAAIYFCGECKRIEREAA